MNILLNGFETKEATFRTLTDLEPGAVVALLESGEVHHAEPGDAFTGIVASCRDCIASVVLKGYAVANFESTVPHMGICKLAPGENGTLEVDETSGKAYTVVGVDFENNKIEFIL